MKAFIAVLIGFVALNGVALASTGQGNVQQGLIQDNDGSVGAIEGGISRYLDGPERESVLSPGEFSEYPVTLKVGQVIIAEARSDAFDPALEVVDKAGKVLASNDDRYPGDQRPLLLWRCPQDGDYSLHVRCYHDKSGGQFFLRSNVYDSVDLTAGKVTEATVGHAGRFLFRVAVKKGSLSQVVAYPSNGDGYVRVGLREVISPIGLPDVNLSRDISSAIKNTLFAPVDGDYYFVAEAPGADRYQVRALLREIVPTVVNQTNGVYTGDGKMNEPGVWSINVKGGELLRASTKGLPLQSPLVCTEIPDISWCSLDQPENNPFFPRDKQKHPDKDAAFIPVPSRAGDPRMGTFVERRDTTLWISTKTDGPTNGTYTMTVAPPDKSLGEVDHGDLRIADVDYWSFNAQAGDVLTFHSGANTFQESATLVDPDLQPIVANNAGLDETSIKWNWIASKPGRYLVEVGCQGNGGGGSYTISRHVEPPFEFGLGHPANGHLTSGQVQVLKFSVQPGKPLLLHWISSDWNFSIDTRRGDGQYASLPMTSVDNNNRFSVVSVGQPTSFILVLRSEGASPSYRVEVTPLPGYTGK